MSKYAIITLLLFSQTLVAMDLVELKREVKKYRTKTFPSLQIAEVGKYFETLPNGFKRRALATMSTRMMLMHAVVTAFPEDVIKQILFFMLDKNMQAAEKFYDMSIDASFKLYNTIKYKLNDDTKPIGPLYVASEEDRQLVLGSMNSIVPYCKPTLTVATIKKINELDENMQQYFTDRQVNVFGDTQIDEMKRVAIFLLGMGLFCAILSVPFGAFIRETFLPDLTISDMVKVACMGFGYTVIVAGSPFLIYVAVKEYFSMKQRAVLG